MQPVRNRDTWTSPLAGVLSTTLSAYYDGLPLRRPRPEVPKSSSALERAIIAGTVIYHQGLFRGDFTAAISKELREMGGTYNSQFKGWSVPPSRVPVKIMNLARQSREQKAGWVAKLQVAVEKAAPVTMIAAMALPGIYRAIATQVAKAITSTTGREVIPALVDPDAGSYFQMTVEQAVKGFSEKESKRLASIIRQAAEEDWGAERLEKTLIGRVGVVPDRAKVMARQGVAIAATDLKAEMYVQAGLPRYRWRTQGDSKVRSDHAMLDGHVFEWAVPPIVNTATGLRAHPGQDWNCRCDAIPVEE